MFELPSQDENITPEKRVNGDKCNFATKQHMFGVFAIDDPRSPDRALYATLEQGKSHVSTSHCGILIVLDSKWPN